MLNRILSEADCAECKLCCGFYESEIWEVPVIDDGLAALISDEYEFDFINGNRVFKINYDEKGLCVCPALSKNGCKLGMSKPFDCKLWPFRAMKLGDSVVITISPLCKKVNGESLSKLVQFVNSDLTEKIKARVQKYPEQIKEYVKDNVILRFL
ncbi:MAG: hypothetical protein LBC86_00520 [Oscillospiraceae bacterium]|jgi:Fe-S-cluster containining protein|nr:hypothetical protein [Oscillospiraceae bacterium]